MDQLKGNPVFCIKTIEKNSRRSMFINFKSTDAVVPPEIDLDEDELCEEIRNPSARIENFKIPMKMSPIYWNKSEKEGEKSYVVDVFINDKFCIRRVLLSDVIRHYLSLVTMIQLEEKYNREGSTNKVGQFIGHKLELNQVSYEVLDDKQSIEKSTDLVNNKITLVEQPKIDSVISVLPNDTIYDLYYRPTSKILTCSVNVDKLPDSIGFNDDRIIIRLDAKILVDTYLPFYIDLSEPAKYKFDDKLCLFRVVFRINECF